MLKLDCLLVGQLIFHIYHMINMMDIYPSQNFILIIHLFKMIYNI